MIEYISSAANSKVKLLRAYYSSAKKRNEDKVFVVEGRKSLNEASADLVDKIYLTKEYLSEHENELDKFKEADVYCLSYDLFDRIVRTNTPQGVAAVIQKKEYSREYFFDKNKVKRLIMCEAVQDPGNLGTIIRTALAAGFDALIVDRQCADVYNPKCVSASMSGIYRLPILCVDDIISCIGELKNRGFACLCATLDADCRYDRCDYPKNLALLVGNEGNGLSNGAVSASDLTISIPMTDSMESLNVAVAAAILMYEINKDCF